MRLVATTPVSLPELDETASLGATEQHHLALFDTWTTQFLASINSVHQPIITNYVRWAQRRRLNQAATTGMFASWSTLGARLQTTQAVALLDWLSERRLTVAELDQPTLDRWVTGGTTTRTHSYHFISWAQRQRHIPRRLRVPHPKPGTATSITPAAHRQIINQIIHDQTISLTDRVACLLVVLYAQPASRIVRLQQRDLTTTPTGPLIRLGGRPIEPAQPLAALLAELIDTDADPNDWLFPGGTPGQPVTAKTMGQRLLRNSVNRATRVAALHHLITEIPSPVLAELIGYNPSYLADLAVTLNTPWAHYAALKTRT